MRDRHVWLPIIHLSVVLMGWIYLSGCAVSAQFMTDAQHRRRTQDRVLIDRSHGSYKGDNAVRGYAATLKEYRARAARRRPSPPAEASSGRRPHRSQ